MKCLITTFAILAVALAGITGIVLAQAPTNSRSSNAFAAERGKVTSIAKGDPVLGKVLFEHVTSVHFCGVTMPANSDGSFGAWVGEKQGDSARMTIYENYIVKEIELPDGTTFRETRPYDKLGAIEQRIPAKANRGHAK